MMRKLLPYIVFVVYTSVCFGGLHDADDGYLTDGEYGDAWLENHDQLIVMGGGADTIDASDNSYVEVRYTSTPLSNSSGIYDIFLYHNSRLLYLNGITEEITIAGNATALIKGGRIDGITSGQNVGWLNGQPVGQHIEMVVKTHSYNDSTHILTGTWLDGSAYEILLLNQPGYADVIDNIIFTPEPATLILLGLGGLLIRQKK